jgi:hypothetical protein
MQLAEWHISSGMIKLLQLGSGHLTAPGGFLAATSMTFVWVDCKLIWNTGR